MLSLYSIWSSFQSLVNTAQNSFFRPQTDFAQQVNDISNEIWEEWTGMAEKSQEIRDHLAPFLISKNLKVEPRNTYYGEALYPKNYGRFASAAVWSLKNQCVPCPNVDGGKCKGVKTQEEVNEEYYANITENEVDLVDAQRWTSCLNHKTKKPTLSKPKITQINGGWKVAPRDASILVLSYYTKPVEGTFKYTVVAGNTVTGDGDYIQYDPTSVPLQWPETVINEFLWRLATRYGLFINSQFLTQFANSKKRA